MARFTDRDGRDWVVRIDVWGVEQVRARTGLDIAKMPSDDEIEKIGDMVLLTNAVWVLCEDQAKAKGLDEKAFKQGIDGDAFEAAAKAFEDAFYDFCPSRLRKAQAANQSKTFSDSVTNSPELSELTLEG